MLAEVTEGVNGLVQQGGFGAFAAILLGIVWGIFKVMQKILDRKDEFIERLLKEFITLQKETLDVVRKCKQNE